MRTPFALGLLVRSLLIASFSSLVACSSVLQANRLSRSFPQQAVEIVAVAPSESVLEQAAFMDEDRQPGTERSHGLPRSMASGYRWVFVAKDGSKNTPGLGKWVLKPNN